jgi:hypothetical protein
MLHRIRLTGVVFIQANQTIAPELPSMFRYNYAIQWHYENMLLTIAPNQSDLMLVRVLILCK